MEKLDIELKTDDVFKNNIGKNDLCMNGTIPWRCPQEKGSRFYQLLIEATTAKGDVVVDCTASVGVLKNMIQTAPIVVPKVIAPVLATQDPDAVAVVPRKFIRKTKQIVRD